MAKKILVNAADTSQPHIVDEADIAAYDAADGWSDVGEAPASLDVKIWNPALLQFNADLSNYKDARAQPVYREGTDNGNFNTLEAATVPALSMKLYLFFEVAAYAGDPAPVAANYPMLNAYATFNSTTLALAYAWARERVMTGWQRAAYHLGYREQLMEAIYAAGSVSAIDAIVEGVDWVNNALDAAPADPSDIPEPMRFGGTDPWTHTKLAADSTVGTTAFANVSGMSFAGEANKMYRVEVFGAYQTVATKTGIALALDIPAGATVIGQVVVNINATGLGGTEQVADATTTGKTTGVRAANTKTPISAVFHVQMGATPGNIQLMQASEVASSNTVLKAGLTVMSYRAI